MKNNNKGMTLVEIIVASAISLIFIGVIGGIYLSLNRYQGSYEEKRNAENVTNTVFDLTKSKLQYATMLAVTTTPDCPKGWEEYGEKWAYIYFEKEENGGHLGYCIHEKDANGVVQEYDSPDIYGSDFYRDNNMYVSVDTAQTDKKAISISFVTTNADGDKLCERNRTIDIINMTNSKTNVILNSKTDNKNEKIYIHYRLDSQVPLIGTNEEDDDVSSYLVVNSSNSEVNEVTIYQGLQSDYEYYVQSMGDNAFAPGYNGTYLNKWSYGYYVKKQTYSGISSNKLSMPLIALYGINNLSWPISTISDPTSSSMILGTISVEKLNRKGIDDLCTGSEMYCNAYHYVQITDSCSHILYASNSSNWSAVDSQYNFKSISTNLVFDGGSWYYFKLNDTSGTAGTSVEKLELLDKSGNLTSILTGLDISFGATIRVTTKAGITETFTIDSATKVFEFFTKYGKKLS